MIHRYSSPDAVRKELQDRVTAAVKTSVVTPHGFTYTILALGIADGSMGGSHQNLRERDHRRRGSD